MKKVLLVAATAFAALVFGATAAYADASAPTNGGNGAGMSGQCTGNPVDRPPVCP